MNIALIIPNSNTNRQSSFYDLTFISTFLLSKRHNSYLLAIPTLAALTPPGHEVRIFDEHITEIDFNWPADLVGISVLTMSAGRAYEICSQYRRLGALTVLGGIHPSMCTEEAIRYGDSVVVGEAEKLWPVVVDDAQNGCLQPVYQAEKKIDLKYSPIPARSELSRDHYLSDVLQTAKGCPFECEFCSVHAFDGQRIRTKKIEQIVREIKEITETGSRYKKRSSIFFVDDNIIANKSFARDLVRAIKPYPINWMCQASMNISDDDELLAMMKDSGCGAVFIGFESISRDNLTDMNKAINKRYQYLDVIKKIQSHEILIHGSFIVGADCDTLSSFDELIAFVRESRLLIPLFNILTPFPGTKLFQRFEAAGRILHKDWSRYDTKHVVFSPLNMHPEELREGYKKIIREVYSFEAIYERLQTYWDLDFWRQNNLADPVRNKYRLLFAIRLASLLVSQKWDRSKFICRVLPSVFKRHVRVSTILSMMSYNDFSYSIE